MKALQKDRNRRYDSAGHLAEDIARYRSDKPINARPPSAVYQIRKLARRHRVKVFAIIGSTSTLLLLFLLAFSILKAWHVARDVQAERQRALEALQQAQAAALSDE